MWYVISSWFLFFFLYSVIGYIAEITFISIKTKKIVFNRGFLIGPYLPIYGFGSLILILFLRRYEEDPIVLFVLGAVFCTTLEYFTSLIMEKIFKLRWWDYSDRKFNINGRVCLDNALLFGLAGIVVVKGIHPLLADLIYFFPAGLTIGLAIFLFLVMLADFCESCYITFRLKINFNNYLHKDATKEIREEVTKAIKKHIVLTSRLVKAFPTATYDANKKFMDFIKLIYNTRKEQRIQKLKRKIKEEENK